jgi:hypothetical protein
VTEVSPSNSGNAAVDTARIQAALDKGGLVRMLAGRWLISTVNFDGSCGVLGDGVDRTSVDVVEGGGGFQINSGRGITTLDTVVQHLTLDGGNVANYGLTLGQATTAPYTGAGHFSDLLIKRFALAGCRTVLTAATKFTRVYFRSNRDGLWSDPTIDNSATTCDFDSCHFITNTKRGLWAQQFDTWLLRSCRVEYNGEEGMLFAHPGTANAAVRGATVDSCYFEGNGTAGAYPDLSFSQTGATLFSLQDCRVRNTRFQNANTDGNIYFGIGAFVEEDNIFVPVGTSNCVTRNSVSCFVNSRSNRDPTTYWTVGANAPTTHWRAGASGQFALYANVSGTVTKVYEAGSGSKLGFFGTNAIAKPTIVAGDLTSVETALINLGLVKY